MRGQNSTPTAAEINAEPVTDYSKKYWSSENVIFERHVVDEMYQKEIKGSGFNTKKIMLFEISQYLEKYLWPHFTVEDETNAAYLISIATMVNEKFRENVDPWLAFKQKPDLFPQYFKALTKLTLSTEVHLTFKERKVILIFLNHCFNGVEVDLVRERIQKYVSLPIWICLSEKRRERELSKAPMLRKFWNAMKKKDAKMDQNLLAETTFERKFLFSYIKWFFTVLAKVPKPDDSQTLDRETMDIVNYCEKFVEFLIDLEALLPTRRFVNALLDDTCVVVVCKKSTLSQRPTEGRLFNQLLERLNFYCRFEIDDITGEALTEQEITKRHYDKIVDLQKLVFKNFPYLRRFYLNSVAAVDSRESLVQHLQQLKEDDLLKLCKMINIADEEKVENELNRNILLDLIVFAYERVVSQLQALNEMPLYPTEAVIWDENVVPTQYFSNDASLALPKLNLQFLTLHDYLLRNFELFRLESTYEIRQDIESALARMRPWRAENGSTMFGGWARMALVIDSFTIVEIAKPKLGEKAPSRVRAEIRVNLNVKREIKREWESLRKHDVCFLICVEPTCPPGTTFKYNESFIPQAGLKYVRGCEIEGMLDPLGKIVEEGSHEKFDFDTDFRTYRVWLDCNQYLVDTTTPELDDVYDSFNVLLRRKPKENNFKAVLESIRDLMNTDCVVPDWIHDILLGYGDPAAAHYLNMESQQKILDFNDTFLDFEHLKSCFPNYEIKAVDNHEDKLKPPFKIKFDENQKCLTVMPYVLPNRGPYPYEQPKKNVVRFTPTQTEAIKSGLQPGLTVVVGPPGTGKTDVAVQIISNLYHSFPEQRTLIVTHSNQALNQLFEKLIALDISERHLLRLGHGEEELDTKKDFSRYGRVNYVLKKRLALLAEVSRLAASLDISADVGYTCETASYFFLYHILSRWEEYMSKLSEKDKNPELVSSFFPFHTYFANAPQPLFHGNSYEEDLEIAKGCYRHIKKMFTQLDEFKAFEMLRSGSDRSKYLLVREARIIAMTCTHAALKRKELVEMGFQYDNILMEEAAQILEIETFIPLLLQNPEHGHNRLKRWIMIGDHNQLPPIIKNVAFQKFSNMEQSLYTRFVRLGVPVVELDAQGRCRESLCSLFRWRYRKLGDLPFVQEQPEYKTVNPGFKFEYQLVDVQVFNGVGESEPIPHFYQNLAEAEYVVGTFMFMRLLGYPAEKITVLTTYNGQKHLIRDVIAQRCASNPFIGVPHTVTTVDKFQGSQNDYILLSLVRTKTVGHIRDIRRLVVAMSRARLGLYVFGRVSLFRNCFELSKSFDILLRNPQKLHLLPDETYPSTALLTDPRTGSQLVIENMPQMSQFVYQFYERKLKQWREEKPEIFETLVKKPESEAEVEPMEQEKPTETLDEDELGFEKITEDDTGMEDVELQLSDSDNETAPKIEETMEKS